jgi:hypothetical protein
MIGMWLPRSFLEKHLLIILPHNNWNNVFLDYWSAKDYDHNWKIDWSYLMAKLLSPLLLLRLKSGQRQCKMGRFHVLG